MRKHHVQEDKFKNLLVQEMKALVAGVCNGYIVSISSEPLGNGVGELFSSSTNKIPISPPRLVTFRLRHPLVVTGKRSSGPSNPSPNR